MNLNEKIEVYEFTKKLSLKLVSHLRKHPSMRIYWYRGGEKIDYSKPTVWSVTGVRGSGKSSFLEYLAIEYLKNNATVVDVFGSRDGENLAWLRSPYVLSGEVKVLILTSERIVLDLSKYFQHFNCLFEAVEVKPISVFSEEDILNYDLIITNSLLYVNSEEEFKKMNKLIDTVYGRLETVDKHVYMLIREASNFVYSRLKLLNNQKEAKTSFIYFIRESRHFNTSVGLDTLRLKAVDIDVRTQSDYIVIKKMGFHSLPHELRWVYAYVDPEAVRSKLEPNMFIIVTKNGDVGFGVFPYHDWHKEQNENIVKQLKIKIRKKTL